MSEPLKTALPQANMSQLAVRFNDLALTLEADTTLAKLLAQQGIPPASVATAVNGQFIPRTLRAHHRLREGDTVLTFQAIVGG